MNIYQAKTNLSKLIEKTLIGENVVIAKAGKPIVKLVVYEKTVKPRNLGLLRGKIFVPDDFNEEDEDINKMFYGEEE